MKDEGRRMNEDEAEIKCRKDQGGKTRIIHPSSFRIHPFV
jgi:hypothetical protein